DDQGLSSDVGLHELLERTWGLTSSPTPTTPSETQSPAMHTSDLGPPLFQIARWVARPDPFPQNDLQNLAFSCIKHRSWSNLRPCITTPDDASRCSVSISDFESSTRKACFGGENR